MAKRVRGVVSMRRLFFKLGARCCLHSHDREVDGDEHQDGLSSEHDEGPSESSGDNRLEREIGALKVGINILVLFRILFAKFLSAFCEDYRES